MSKDITIDSPEFKALYEEVSKRAEAIRQRERLSDRSFRDWLCEAIQLLAEKLGYHIQNIYEFTADMVSSFSKGFKAGRERARAKAYRKKDTGEEE